MDVVIACVHNKKNKSHLVGALMQPTHTHIIFLSGKAFEFGSRHCINTTKLDELPIVVSLSAPGRQSLLRCVKQRLQQTVRHPKITLHTPLPTTIGVRSWK
jgi:hypothetical protein